MESKVVEDLSVGSELLEPSESFEDFSVLKLALDRLLRSLKKGIVPANTVSWTVSTTAQNVQSLSEKLAKNFLRCLLRHVERLSAEHVNMVTSGKSKGSGGFPACC